LRPQFHQQQSRSSYVILLQLAKAAVSFRELVSVLYSIDGIISRGDIATCITLSQTKPGLTRPSVLANSTARFIAVGFIDWPGRVRFSNDSERWQVGTYGVSDV
jgi:hypothetical protein